MSALTHTQQVALQKGRGLTLVRAADAQGRPFYVYVLASGDQIKHLQRAHDEGRDIRFADYGDVIHKDWGEEPSDAIKRYMEEHYGFIHP